METRCLVSLERRVFWLLTLNSLFIMKVLYYYYYLFYSKILPDDEPHATTVFTLSSSEGFLINGALDIFLTRFLS